MSLIIPDKRFYRNEMLNFSEISLKNIKNNNKPIFENKIWYSYGRQALGGGLDILKISSGESVLLPSFICNELIPVFIKRKINIEFYNIDENFNPDFEDLNRKIKNNTRAILLINYFGFYRKNSDIKKLCEDNKIFLIEDN